MIKNQANIYQFVLRDMIGQGMTGLSPTVQIRKDSGSFAATTNAPTEVGYGAYEVILTATECNCDVMMFMVTLPDGQFPAILTNEYLTTTGGATPAEIWGFTGEKFVDNTIPTVNEIWGRQAGDTTSRTLTNLNIQSELTTYGAAKTSDIPDVSSIQSGLATSSDLSSVATNVSAVKAKTDNLPASPAAVGSAMTLTETTVSTVRNNLATVSTIEAAVVSLSSGLDTLAGHGDTYWLTADLSGLSTFDPTTDTVLIDATQAAGMATATGFATPSDIPSAENIWEYPTRTITDSPDIQAELTTYGAAKTSDIPTSEDIWTYPTRELTSEIVIGISAQNIKDITDSVWDAPDRTLTDLKPKPNGKNIVCTPTNVTNAYGVPRLENWTNETSGTTAFDEKIETYITLAKEKMATDLNDHINAAIDYIGADNITELCAWLTGYNLYKDDESTDTDSLPETRYNQYLEQIHRIMENI